MKTYHTEEYSHRKMFGRGGAIATIVVIASIAVMAMIGSLPVEHKDADLAEIVGPAPDLEAMVASAEVIVIGSIYSVVQQSQFGGYNVNGTAIPVPTYTPSAWMPTASPPPQSAVPLTDFLISVGELIEDDETENPLHLRMTRKLGANATQVAADDASDFPMGKVGEGYLFFLKANPDSTYGLHHGPFDRLIITGLTVTYSDGARTPVPFASGMTPSEFVQAVRDEVEEQEG